MNATVTFATRITILRILLIPLFAVLIIYYERSEQNGVYNESLLWWAAAVFLIAAISDGVDGFIARRFNQQSSLGRILDPIADKGLLVTAVILLSWSHIDPPWRFPLWFPVVILSRDLLLILGFAVLHLLIGKVEVRPNWTGKTATVLQMTAITTAMLRPSWFPFDLIVILAGAVTALSLVLYTLDGLHQLNDAGHTKPTGV